MDEISRKATLKAKSPSQIDIAFDMVFDQVFRIDGFGSQEDIAKTKDFIYWMKDKGSKINYELVLSTLRMTLSKNIGKILIFVMIT